MRAIMNKLVDAVENLQKMSILAVCLSVAATGAFD